MRFLAQFYRAKLNPLQLIRCDDDFRLSGAKHKQISDCLQRSSEARAGKGGKFFFLLVIDNWKLESIIDARREEKGNAGKRKGKD